MRRLPCRDPGFACEGFLEAQSTDEVLDLAGQHAKQVHGADVTPEMVDAISMQIRDASGISLWTACAGGWRR